MTFSWGATKEETEAAGVGREREGAGVSDQHPENVEVEIGPDDIRNNQDVVNSPFLTPMEKLLILGGKIQNPEWD